MKMSYMLCVLLGSSAYGQVFTCNTQRQNWPSDIIMMRVIACLFVLIILRSLYLKFTSACFLCFVCFNHTVFTLLRV